MGVGVNAFFTFSAVIDAMNPGVMIGEFDQGGFTLPVRDMYLSPSQLLTDYQATVAKVRTIMGTPVLIDDDPTMCLLQLFTLLDGNATLAAAKAAAVVRVETALAQAALPADEIR
jgi:predicted metalloendopeptidase